MKHKLVTQSDMKNTKETYRKQKTCGSDQQKEIFNIEERKRQQIFVESSITHRHQSADAVQAP